MKEIFFKKDRVRAFFDPIPHVYTDHDGNVYRSVTQIMEPLSCKLYRMIPREVLDNAAYLGTAVHLATELDDADELDESSLVDEWIPYLKAWRAFKKAFKPQILAKELRLIHPVKHYAGAIDRVVYLNNAFWVIDLKTTNQLYNIVAIQLAAYAELLRVNIENPPTFRRAAVQLKDDGTFSFKEHTSRDDLSAFFSLLTISNWETKHGKVGIAKD